MQRISGRCYMVELFSINLLQFCIECWERIRREDSPTVAGVTVVEVNVSMAYRYGQSLKGWAPAPLIKRIPRSSATGWKTRKGLVWKGKRRVPFPYKIASQTPLIPRSSAAGRFISNLSGSESLKSPPRAPRLNISMGRPGISGYGESIWGWNLGWGTGNVDLCGIFSGNVILGSSDLVRP